MRRYCFNCKVGVRKDSEFCIECGTKLEYEKLSISTYTPEEKISLEDESSDKALVGSMAIDEISAESELPDKGLVENKLSNIVLVTSVLAVLFLFWNFLWWIFIRNGNPGLVKDLNILILFCSPSLLLGIASIILGNKDLAKIRIRVVRFNKKDLDIDITGIILGSASVGMIFSLILIRLIFFL